MEIRCGSEGRQFWIILFPSFLPFLSFPSFPMIAFYEIQGAKGCRIHACAMHRGNLNLEPGFSRQL
jgi:hypothetical protein